MLHDLVRETAPANPLVPVETAKAQLRVLHAEDDALIEALAETAADRLDGPAGILGRALIQQSWTLYLDRFPSVLFPLLWQTVPVMPRRPFDVIELPLAPLISVESIGYVDAGGVDQVVDPATYKVLDGERAEIRLLQGQCWPATSCDPRSVTVQFTCGYGPAASDVPAPIRHAALLLIGHLYEHREAVVGVDNRDSSAELPLGVTTLLAPYRRWRV